MSAANWEQSNIMELDWPIVGYSRGNVSDSTIDQNSEPKFHCISKITTNIFYISQNRTRLKKKMKAQVLVSIFIDPNYIKKNKN